VIALPEQPLAERVLRQALARPDPPQQILVFGPPSTGKREAARRIAWALADPEGEHAPEEVSLDITIISGTGALIRREEIDPALADIHARPAVAKRRVLVIDEAHRLWETESAPRLLRTLEEPPPRSHIVLVTDRVEDLLPTLRSRCAPVPFRFPGWEAVDARRDPLEARMAGLAADLALAALAGTDSPGHLVADIESRMLDLVAERPSDTLKELRARAAELEGKRGARTAEKRAEDQAKRERRRAVTDGWGHVLAGMAALTRDALALALGAESLRHEGHRQEIAAIAERAGPDPLVASIEAIELARSELWLNPTTTMAAEALVARIRALLRGESPPLLAAGRLPY